MNKKEEHFSKDNHEAEPAHESGQEKDQKAEAQKHVSSEELLKKKQEEYNELWDKYIRTCADFENTRKRLEREKQDVIKFANEGMVIELLNVLDDLERTVALAQSGHEDIAAFLKGIQMVLAHLYEMLKRYGVKPIEAEGKIFDPNFHEALMQVENNDLAEHTIVEELQKGYLLNDRVIRTSKVKVSKHISEDRGPKTEDR
jgi:molecular chaperone GrpE